MERRQIDWDHHIESFESSGLKAPDYCSLHSLNLGTFRSRLYKYRALHSRSGEFREILVNTELSLSVDTHGQLTLSGFEPDVLPTIIRAWSDALSQ